MPQRTATSSHQPTIDYSDARFSYFIFRDTQIHSVKDCPAETFKEAVLEALGKKKLHDSCKALMKQEKLDMVSRWYILNSLCEIGKPLKLYRCFADAEKAIQDAAK